MEYAFGGFIPWLLRALTALSEVAPNTSDYFWTELAVRFETSRLIDEEAIDLMLAQGTSE